MKAEALKAGERRWGEIKRYCSALRENTRKFTSQSSIDSACQVFRQLTCFTQVYCFMATAGDEFHSNDEGGYNANNFVKGFQIAPLLSRSSRACSLASSLTLGSKRRPSSARAHTS